MINVRKMSVSVWSVVSWGNPFQSKGQEIFKVFFHTKNPLSSFFSMKLVLLYWRKLKIKVKQRHLEAVPIARLFRLYSAFDNDRTYVVEKDLGEKFQELENIKS